MIEPAEDDTRPLVHMARKGDGEAFCPLERDHISLAPETINKIHNAVSDGIVAGIKRSVTPQLAETLWGVFFKMLEKRAKDQAGAFVLGWLRKLVKAIFYVVILLALVYSVGGWPLVVATWKVVFK